MAKDRLVSELGCLLRSDTFTCGDSIGIGDGEGQLMDVSIRYDGKTAVAPKRTTRSSPALTSPPKTIKLDFGSATPTEIEALVEACEPASFGFKGKDILDTQYRDAVQLDPSKFSTNFDPHAIGIVDTIARYMMPSDADLERSVYAELYKLNIYSAPNGKFKAHVDTPRSEDHFGSLVVCLPSPHQGGALVVQDNGVRIAHDWSTQGPATVSWAAFFADCEHEVAQVTSGHRITLTYNLYCRSSALTTSAQLQLSSLPAYKETVKILESPDFLPDGGLLGIYLSHSYAHNRRQHRLSIPLESLKGKDLTIYRIFSELGLKINLAPVLQTDREDHYPSDEEDAVYIGRRFGSPALDSDETEHASDRQNVFEYHFPNKWDESDIVWLNGPHHDELALVFLAYGNQASPDTRYSAAAVFIEVAPVEERNRGRGEGERGISGSKEWSRSKQEQDAQYA